MITGRYYYGMHSTNNLEDGYLGSGKRLRYSINKYGEEAHKREILEFLPDRSSLKDREKEVVNLNEIAKEDCMNLKEGGDGGFSPELQSILGSRSNEKRWKIPENREKQAKVASELCRRLHEEGVMKAPDWTGKYHKPETIEKMRNHKRQSGLKNSQFGTKWIHNSELKKSKRIKKTEKIPEGWKSGRKMFKTS